MICAQKHAASFARRIAATLIFVCPSILVSTGAHATQCQPTPTPIRDLDLTRYYGDKAGTKVDQKKKVQHGHETAALKIFVRQLALYADTPWALQAAQTVGAPSINRCLTHWLSDWAKAEALLGKMGSKQAEYQRKWDLAGIALTYLKVRPGVSPEERAVIEPWLKKLAVAARRFFDDPGRKRNNHWYWLGLGVGATALATDDDDLWRQAREIFTDSTHHIAKDGSLPMELARGHLALKYHNFSVMPLVVLAELAAAARDEDWYAINDSALHRLAKTTVAAFNDPVGFAKIAGTPQPLPGNPSNGWYTLYSKRFPDTPPLRTGRPKPGHRWLGGNVEYLMKSVQLARSRSR